MRVKALKKFEQQSTSYPPKVNGVCICVYSISYRK